MSILKGWKIRPWNLKVFGILLPNPCSDFHHRDGSRTCLSNMVYQKWLSKRFKRMVKQNHSYTILSWADAWLPTEANQHQNPCVVFSRSQQHPPQKISQDYTSERISLHPWTFTYSAKGRQNKSLNGLFFLLNICHPQKFIQVSLLGWVSLCSFTQSR